MTRATSLSAAAVAVALLALSADGRAVEVAGVRIDDEAKVAGRELTLNGAGVRTKMIFKVYAMGLYLPKKEASTEAVLASAGPRRVALVMMRDVAASEFGQAFMGGVNANSDKADIAKVGPQLAKFGAVFDGLGSLKKGDSLNLDYVPEKGTSISLNGKSIGESFPDIAFYNMLLRNWLGEKPVDGSLKPLLLGAK